jgi:hypothetical protein
LSPPAHYFPVGPAFPELVQLFQPCLDFLLLSVFGFI